MTPELDVEGVAAPPRINGELAFEHPWQSRLFATTMALCDAGVLEYVVFRDRLIAHIARREQVPDQPDSYWSSWQDALEELVAQHGLCASEELERRAREFAEHG